MSANPPPRAACRGQSSQVGRVAGQAIIHAKAIKFKCGSHQRISICTSTIRLFQLCLKFIEQAVVVYDEVAKPFHIP